MSTNLLNDSPLETPVAPASIAPAISRSARWKFVGLWLLIGLIAAAAASLKWPAAHFAGEYVPVTNDSFYHARRILDAAADPAAFYEFDPRIHAPEGSLLAWPWGYDYAMAWLVRAGLALGVSDSPVRILIWLPVLASFVSMGLMLLLARRVGLVGPFLVIAGLAAALSPLTQFLHAVGQIDHHYAEYIFILASLACGLRWLQRPDDARAAIVIGAVLGAAPAIHNGLFILQLPLLATLLALWLQDVRMPIRTALLFAGALLATTLAIEIPSLPFRQGLFQYYTLSWFHMYVAACSAAVAVALAGLARNKRNIALLAGAGIVLLLPLASQIVMARAFLSGTIERLNAIAEMRPVPPMLWSDAGRAALARMYSLLAFLTPLIVIYSAWRGWRERSTPRLLFWIWSIFGLMLLLTQFRLHYFGSFALYLPLLLFAQSCAMRWEQRHKLVVLSTALVFLLAYWIPVRYTLIASWPVGGDPALTSLRPILEDLRKACAQEPGIVLADNDAGHYIRYYTECSVIANNFLLTPQHEAKIREIDYLTSLPASALPGVAPYVRYVLLRPVSIFGGEDEVTYVSFSQTSGQLINDLLLQPLDRIPANYELLQQASLSGVAKEGSVPYIRLFKVGPHNQVEAPAPASPKTAAE